MWIEIQLHTTHDKANHLSDQLTLLGAQAVSFQDAGNQPIYEPEPGNMSLWQKTIVIGLFDAARVAPSLLSDINQLKIEQQIDSFTLRHIADQDWERTCLEYYQPIAFGKRLWICPSWHTPPAADAVNVMLDPGLAFGTGTHPTTALCLRWLDEHIASGMRVIDYGCGSGILGLAALKLGATEVLAIDNDPQALIATENNGRTNGITAPALVTQLPRQTALIPPADLLIANILAAPLIELAPHFATLIKPGKRILLSGILIEQITTVQDAYTQWIQWDTPMQQDEWACLAGTYTHAAKTCT